MESASEIYVVDNENILLENVNNSSLFNFVEMDSEKNSTIVLTTPSTPPPLYTKDMVFNDGHLLSIIVYSCLFFFSATGMLHFLCCMLNIACRLSNVLVSTSQNSPVSRGYQLSDFSYKIPAHCLPHITFYPFAMYTFLEMKNR